MTSGWEGHADDRRHAAHELHFPNTLAPRARRYRTDTRLASASGQRANLEGKNATFFVGMDRHIQVRARITKTPNDLGMPCVNAIQSFKERHIRMFKNLCFLTAICPSTFWGEISMADQILENNPPSHEFNF
jgi:hypothetical protein